jgi:hypothetical protein
MLNEMIALVEVPATARPVHPATSESVRHATPDPAAEHGGSPCDRCYTVKMLT